MWPSTYVQRASKIVIVFTGYYFSKISLTMRWRWSLQHDHHYLVQFQIYILLGCFRLCTFWVWENQIYHVFIDHVCPIGCHITFRTHYTQSIGPFDTLISIVTIPFDLVSHFCEASCRHGDNLVTIYSLVKVSYTAVGDARFTMTKQHILAMERMALLPKWWVDGSL